MLSGKKRGREASPDQNSEDLNIEEQMIQELGYGTSLFKSVEDEQHILSLKEMERERILNERHQNMLKVKEKIKLLKEFKAQQEPQALQNTTKTGALADLKNRRERRLQKNRSLSQDKSSESGSEEIKSHKSRSEYSSDEESHDPMDLDHGIPRKDIGISDLEKIRVNRIDLEKWHTELLFEEVIKGSFVRINMGEAVEAGRSPYKIFQVQRVKQASKPYRFGDGQAMISKELVGKHGRDSKTFQMAVVSNSKFTSQEFSEWRSACDKGSDHLPSLDKIDDIESQLNKIKNHSYTPQEVNKIIEQNINQLIEKGSSSMNLTYIRTQLETQLQLAEKTLRENDCHEAREIYNNVKLKLQKVNEIRKKKAEDAKKSMNAANFNRKAERLQIEEDRKRSEMVKKRQKQSAGFDAFSTLACKPSILWNTNNNEDKMAEAQKALNQTSVPDMAAKDDDSHVISEGGTKRRNKLDFKTDFERAVERKNRIIEHMKSVDLGIDDLVSTNTNDIPKLPAFHKMPKLTQLNPILRAKLKAKEENNMKNETRKVYTFNEYVKEFGTV